MNKCCGTCKWCCQEDFGCVCVNDDSNYFTDLIDYYYVCEYWEGSYVLGGY